MAAIVFQESYTMGVCTRSLHVVFMKPLEKGHFQAILLCFVAKNKKGWANLYGNYCYVCINQ